MAGGVEFRAVRASLDTLAKTVRSAAANQKTAFAYANSGILQLAAGVLTSRYLVPGYYAESSPKDLRGLRYKEPPGATHGPMIRTIRDQSGSILRDERGRFVERMVEQKRFVKGKFVTRSGDLEDAFRDLQADPPKAEASRQLVRMTGQDGQIDAWIDRHGNGLIKMAGGYRAAEVGSRKSGRAGIKGVWRSLRTVQGRWATLLRKRYPDLLKLRAV